MNRKKLFTFTIAVGFGVLLLARPAAPQATAEQKEFLKAFVATTGKMPREQRAALSSGMRHALHYAAAVSVDRIVDSKISDNTVNLAPGVQRASLVLSSAGPGGTTRVSDPNLDFMGSVFTGFAQNTTSSARCGNSIVVGYEDTGATLRSGGRSMNGVSFSGDGGQTFTDVGFLNPGPGPSILAGDPVVACSSASRFYYASNFETTRPGGSCNPYCPVSAISVSISSDGGRSWGSPVVAAANNDCCHTLDKPWLAVDPTNVSRLFLTYTDDVCCAPAIKLVRSNDGGSTWSAPIVLDQEPSGQFFPNVVSGSNVAVAPDGQVYVAYEFFTGGLSSTGPREIHFQRSLDHGQTFGVPLKVSDIVGNGAAYGGYPRSDLEGDFLINEFPQLAVDRTSGPSNGTLYITWSDGRHKVRPDALGGTYAYADIVVAKSTNHGLSFTVPAPVSPTPATFQGPGRDQFFPGIAVDGSGKVAVCYYDRRNDPTNLAIDRYCSLSVNHGSTWQDMRASGPAWLPFQADFFVHDLGEYDALTSDFLLQNSGFFGAFVIEEDGNPNIVGRKF